MAAAQQGKDILLNPEKYLGKKVNLIAHIDHSYKPLESLKDDGKFFAIRTMKYERGAYGKNELVDDSGMERIWVFVPNNKISSFVDSYKNQEKPKPLRGTLSELSVEEMQAIEKKTEELHGESIARYNLKYFVNTQKDSD